MDLEVRWDSPFRLFKSKDDLIYDVEEFDSLPDVPGVYVFARSHGESVCPLYIGQAMNIRVRIEQQLNNVRLMRGIERAPTGGRVLYVGEFVSKGGQQAKKALAVIESGLISTAMVEGFELINVQGTKSLAHSITSTGNRGARSWLPENIIRLRRA